jgi:hypothetical protein
VSYQYSVSLRNAKLNQIQSIVGASGVLKIFSGAEPANCAAADPSGLLVTINLPATFLNTASAGQVTLAGTWSGSASGSGTAASWRIYDGSAVCHVQGNIGTDMTLDNTSINSGQVVTVATFTVNAGNA